MNLDNQRLVPAAITQLRAEIEALPKDSGGKRQGISEELKRRVVSALASSKMPMSEFASAVSVSISAVNSWSKRLEGQNDGVRLKGPKGISGFRKMALVAEPEGPAGRFTIEGPNGMKVSDLSADDLARLWRALC